MATNKELTAKNRELKVDLKRCAQKVTELEHELNETAESRLNLAEENDQLVYAVKALRIHADKCDKERGSLKEAISGFDSPAYKTYLGLAAKMGKKDTDIIDISIRVGLLRRVYELAASGRPIEEEEGEKDA